MIPLNTILRYSAWGLSKKFKRRKSAHYRKMYNREEIKSLIKAEFQVEVEGNDPGILKAALVKRLNELILTDFQKLVNILYRLDVSESKLKQLLKENKEQDAGKIIAELIIERQIQKMKTKRSQPPPGNIDENEKW
jgi:hypothetical protein